MTEKREVELMMCVFCMKWKAWDDGFPVRMDARCWECWHKQHLRDEHPRVIRRARRDAAKKAKQRIKYEVKTSVDQAMIEQQLQRKEVI